MSTTPAATTSTSSSLVFPPGFVWGAATASYQIEGAATEDGRVPSIWDAFSHVPGAVVNADNGDVACDHYHRYPEDVALMKRLGLGAYRLSTAWPRIMPEPGRVNQAGLDFYSRLVDELLGAGITPWVTLYHWDLPQSLEDRGGWANRETAERFAEYAVATHAALKDRVRHWITLNEPWCSAYLGYVGGQHAPGRQEPEAGAAAVHHLLLGHGLAVRALREADPDAVVGITLNPTVADPADADDPTDVAAAERLEAQHNGVFLDPLFRGEYPALVVEDFAREGAELPVQDGDLELISAQLDFLGVNFYNGQLVTTHVPGEELPDGAPVERPTRHPHIGQDDIKTISRGLPRTAMGWEVTPDQFRRLLVSLHERYTGPAGIPLYVTENGSAYEDVVQPDGSVQDDDRCDYLVQHLGAMHQAIDEGADVRGYFAWSLLDNYEWAWGYGKRFGIVRVDFDTQERTPKSSALLYGQVARTGEAPTAYVPGRASGGVSSDAAGVVHEGETGDGPAAGSTTVAP